MVQLTAGTSTGSIIASGIALGLSAAEMTVLYAEVAPQVFVKTLRYYLWPILTYRYSNTCLKRELDSITQGKTMGDLWTDARKFDLVIVARDLHEARTRFIKPWKPEYKAMPITTAILASSAAPTYLPVVEGRFIDGGVGSLGNPCFIAAFEARLVLGWKPEETTLLSLGTGKLAPNQGGLPLHAVDHYVSFQWIEPIVDLFLSDANDQQARITNLLFDGLDLRRFQITTEPIALDDVSKLNELIEYGTRLGQMILDDQTDPHLNVPIYRVD